MPDDLPNALLELELPGGLLVRLKCRDAVALAAHPESWAVAQMVLRELGGEVVKTGIPGPPALSPTEPEEREEAERHQVTPVAQATFDFVRHI